LLALMALAVLLREARGGSPHVYSLRDRSTGTLTGTIKSGHGPLSVLDGESTGTGLFLRFDARVPVAVLPF
jgi:hypothetical protein